MYVCETLENCYAYKIKILLRTGRSIPACEGWTDEDMELSDVGVGSSNSSEKYENGHI